MGRKPLINREDVLAAALALADETGLDAVTMQAVADRLGVTPMALYRHVANKADLLDGMVEGLLSRVRRPAPGRPWPERLAAMAGAIRSVARRHPSVFTLLLQRPAVTPAARLARDAIHDALREAGVPEQRVARVERVVSTMVLGFAASEAGGRFAHLSRAAVDADFADLTSAAARYIEAARA